MARAVKGLDRLVRQMRALPEALKAEAKAALDENMAALAQRIEAAAPDAKLKASVGHGAAPPATSASGAFRPDAAELMQMKVAAGLRQAVWAGNNEAYWARWSEFGTAAHSVAKGASRKSGRLQDKGPHHPGGRAQPFFYPTIRAQAPRLKGRIVSACSRAAKRMAATS